MSKSKENKPHMELASNILAGVITASLLFVAKLIYDYFGSFKTASIIFVFFLSAILLLYLFIKSKNKLKKWGLFFSFLTVSGLGAVFIFESIYAEIKRVIRPTILIVYPKEILYPSQSQKLLEALNKLPKRIPWSNSDLKIQTLSYSPSLIDASKPSLISEEIAENPYVRAIIVISAISESSIMLRIATPSNSFWTKNRSMYSDSEESEKITNKDVTFIRRLGFEGAHVSLGVELDESPFNLRYGLGFVLGMGFFNEIDLEKHNKIYQSYEYNSKNLKSILEQQIYSTALILLDESGFFNEKCRQLDKYINLSWIKKDSINEFPIIGMMHYECVARSSDINSRIEYINEFQEIDDSFNNTIIVNLVQEFLEGRLGHSEIGRLTNNERNQKLFNTAIALKKCLTPTSLHVDTPHCLVDTMLEHKETLKNNKSFRKSIFKRYFFEILNDESIYEKYITLLNDTNINIDELCYSMFFGHNLEVYETGYQRLCIDNIDVGNSARKILSLYKNAKSLAKHVEENSHVDIETIRLVKAIIKYFTDLRKIENYQIELLHAAIDRTEDERIDDALNSILSLELPFIKSFNNTSQRITNGSPSKFLHLFSDQVTHPLSDRKQNAEAKELLLSVYDNISDPIIRFTVVSTAVKILGYELKTVPSFLDIYPEYKNVYSLIPETLVESIDTIVLNEEVDINLIHKKAELLRKEEDEEASLYFTFLAENAKNNLHKDYYLSQLNAKEKHQYCLEIGSSRINLIEYDSLLLLGETLDEVLPTSSILAGLTMLEDDPSFDEASLFSLTSRLFDEVDSDTLYDIQEKAPGSLSLYVKIHNLVQKYFSNSIFTIRSRQSVNEQFLFFLESNLRVSASDYCIERISKISSAFGYENRIATKLKLNENK